VSAWAGVYLDCGGPLCVDAASASARLLTKGGVSVQRAAAVQINLLALEKLSRVVNRTTGAKHGLSRKAHFVVIKFLDKDHVTEEWTWKADGKETTSVFHLQRVK